MPPTKDSEFALSDSSLNIFKSVTLSTDTFMVEDAVEAIGFGTFQWKLSILTGLSWVTILYNTKRNVERE